MSPFSEAARVRLEKSGWQPNRTLDTFAYLAALESERHPIFPTVTEFLRSFGGLQIHFKHFATGGDDTLSLDPFEAADSIPREHIDGYEKRVGAKLCPVGEAFSRHYIVMIDPAGRLFAGYDDTLVLLGNTPEEAIENLCQGRDLEVLSRTW
ncbi:SUKH-3 domain-containing protein [soil metagenome]